MIEFGDGAPGSGSYARVAARHPVSANPGARVHVEAVFTALDEGDRRRIAARLGGRE